MFTMKAMRQQYEAHGDNVVMFDDEGNGPYSANPGDYFMCADDHEFAGHLAVRVPERYVVTVDA